MTNYDVLNEFVPKTQELHRAIFDKGYEQGFSEVGKAFCDGQAYILDKIRDEIKAKYDTIPWRDNDYDDGWVEALEWVLDDVIDKYKAERGDK